MNPDWQERQEHWRHFSRWEGAQLSKLSDDYLAALRWMSKAWDLTRRLDPEWDSKTAVEEHWRHLIRTHEALRRIQK